MPVFRSPGQFRFFLFLMQLAGRSVFSGTDDALPPPGLSFLGAAMAEAQAHAMVGIPAHTALQLISQETPDGS
jgi:hypothetical protein